MAIYQSKGRRVALEGTEISRGFKGQQVYDPSESLLRAGDRQIAQYQRASEQILNQNQNNIEALSEFSDTLSSFLIKRQEKVNEEQKNLGIADIINGTTRLNPELYDKYKEQRDYLEKANDATLQVGEGLKQDDPGLAETFIQKAPAVKGWRAYGQAVGKAQVAAAQLENFFESFMKSNEAIAFTNAEGKVESFTPQTIQTQEQLSAAWDVGLQRFIEMSGMSQINPVILAEHLTPTTMRTRSELLGRRMREIIQTRENNERESLSGELSIQAAQMAKNPSAAAQTIQRINKRFTELRGMDRTAGNEDTNNAMRETIRALAGINRFEAQDLYENYKATPINPDKPELGTWGSRFDLTDVGTFLQQTAKTQQDEADVKIKEEADGILQVHFANPTPNSLKEATSRLLKLPQTEEVRATLAQLNANGPYYSPAREQYLIDNAKTPAELDVLRTSGAISNEGYQRGTLKFAEEKDFSKLLPNRSRIEGGIRAKLKAIFGRLSGITPEDFSDRTGLLTDDLSGRIMAYIMGGMRAGTIAQTPEAASEAVAKFIDENVDAYYATDSKGNPSFFSTPKDSRFSGSVLSTITTSDGRTGLQILNAQLDKLPANLSAITTLRLDADRIESAADVLKAGGQAPSDIDFLAKRTGVSVPKLLEQQAKFYPGLQLDMNAINNGNQVYQQNKQINPVIAEQLRNPRITEQQRVQLNADLRRQRLQREAAAQPAQELTSFGKQLSSVVYEDPSGQPGVDLFFEDKNFPVVLPGVVKDVRYQSGYGHFVVIESTDPETGEQVDVLYAHLASRTPLKLGQQVTAGQLVGKQGGTGNVRSADGTIASIDFLAPAPRGSGSMAPYRNFDRLRRRVVQSLGSKFK
jgi:murein DD-endopeptidase MepM/ murein hydrolase activator NlpD